MPYARKDQITWLPKHYYHIYNRGARRVTIFREPDNYHFVLYQVKDYLQKLNLSIIVYCLMPNHYHFLVRQNGDVRAGLLPQRVFNSYTKAYNKRYQHSGTIFEGRYKTVMVEQESHLKHLCRYVHLNPVKDGIVSHVEDWPYCNYPEWIGIRNGTLVDRDFIKAYFGQAEDYKKFVLDFQGKYSLPEELGYLDLPGFRPMR
jgi:putative transposase